MEESSVLIAGPRFYDYTENVKNVFELNGYKVFMIDYVFQGKIYTKNIDQKHIEEFNQNIVTCVTEQELDKVVVISGIRVSREALISIKKKKVPLVLLLQDSVYRSLPDISLLDYYDKVLLFENSDKESLSTMGIKNIEFFGTPVSLKKYFPIDNVKKDIDISFVGAFDADRLAVLEALVGRFPQLNMAFYGLYIGKRVPKPSRLVKYYLKNYRRYFMNKKISFNEINELYNRSKICINIQKSQSIWGCSYRTFEILATKGFQLSSSNPYLEQEFKNGGVVTYRSIRDLSDKVEYYLANEKERLRHGEVGYQYVVQHSYENKFHFF